MKITVNDRFNLISLFVLALSVAMIEPALGKDLIVDGKNPAAKDDNAGTLEAPFKTIQAAMDQAQAGDSVEVRAGVYPETVTFKRGGSYPGGAIETWSPRDLKWLTLEAYKNEHVVLEGAVTIGAEKWKLVEGCKNTYWTPFVSEEQNGHKVNMVFRNETLIWPTLKNVQGKNSSLIEGSPSNIVPFMTGDGVADEGFYYDHQQKKLFVNLGGLAPGKDVQVKAVQLIVGVDACSKCFVRVRKLEVRDFIGVGIGIYNDQEFMVEDCYIHHCGGGFWGGPSGVGTIRRNTVADITGVGLGLGGSRGTVVEENVIKRTHLNPYKVVAWDGAAVIANGAFGFIFRNNVVADCKDICGFWPDCSALGIACYGNAIYHMDNNCGFYIEASTTGTILRWNTVFDNGDGIVFRQNWANTAFENYTFHNQRTGLAIGSCDQDGLPKASTMVYNWVIDNGIGASFGPDLLGEAAHNFDHNVYKFQNWPEADLKGKKPLIARVEKNIDVHPDKAEWPGTNLQKDFSIAWTGAIKIEKDGVYKFYSKACNGSRVFIDGKPVVNNASFHGTETENDGKAELTAGNHEFNVDFYCDRGMQGCVVSWEPPGGAKAAIPESALFHKDPAGGALAPGLNAEYFDIAGASMPFDQSKPVILQFGAKQYMDMAKLRSELGLEMHGKVVTEFDPTPLGLVTFRVHDTRKSWEPVPMFGNPNTERNDVLQGDEDHPYFWAKGSFQGVEDYGWHGVDVSYGTVSHGDDTGFLRQLRVPGKFAIPANWQQGVDEKSAAREGNVACLQVGSVRDKTISADGIGFWGASLPTTDDAQIDLSLWVRAKNVKAAKPASNSSEKMAGRENGGLYVTVQFTDETGQNASRQYLVSADDGQKAAGEDWITGEYLYKNLKAMVTAPKGARWFRLGFGLRNCTGWVAFNDIDIHTRPGTPEAEIKRVLPIDPKRFTWSVCDLSSLFNRPLADDVDNDGKGGWTDQGPTMDMRNLQAGDYTWNDVAFRVAKGNACFIMKNKNRPSENLPAGGKVDLKGKADVLAFLQTGGWISADVQQATYIVNYDDGTKVEIPVIGGKNIIDWVAPPSRADEVKYDPALGFIMPATSVASPQFVHVTVWMVLWKNPHPDKQITTLEIKGANEGAPGLIGISRGVAK